MSEEELQRHLADIQKKGFDESFQDFCAKAFSSCKYASESLAAARMHAYYLRLSIEKLVNPESRVELLQNRAESEDLLEDTFRTVTVQSYLAALSCDRPYCELFIDNWCSAWAEKG